MNVSVFNVCTVFECDSLNLPHCFGGVAGLLTRFPDKGVPTQSGPLGFRDR